MAVDASSFTAVKQCVEVSTPVDIRDDEHQLPTSLHSCIAHRVIAIARLMIHSGFNLSTVNSYGEIPLHRTVATRLPNESMVRLLIDAGANLSVTTGFGEMALATVTRLGTASVIQHPLHDGAGVRKSGSSGKVGSRVAKKSHHCFIGRPRSDRPVDRHLAI
jgi:ankyrin repeat protein